MMRNSTGTLPSLERVTPSKMPVAAQRMRPPERASVYSQIAFTLFGIFFGAYSVFHQFFAQIRIQLPFLDFPIFVGEILLFVCGVLLLLKWRQESVTLWNWRFWVALYFAWVLAKALEGYLTYGPLALRHSALFYYPLFLLMGFSFYDRRLFGQKVIYFVLIAIIALDQIAKIYRFWHWAYCAAYAILAMRLQNRWAKYAFLVGLLALFPIKGFFEGSRSHLLGIVAAFTFLWGCVTFVYLRGRRGRQVAFTAMTVSILGLGIVRFPDKSAFLSFVQLGDLFKIYKETQQLVKEREGKFLFQEIEPLLYRKSEVPIPRNRYQAFFRIGSWESAKKWFRVHEEARSLVERKILEPVTVAKTKSGGEEGGEPKVSTPGSTPNPVDVRRVEESFVEVVTPVETVVKTHLIDAEEGADEARVERVEKELREEVSRLLQEGVDSSHLSDIPQPVVDQVVAAKTEEIIHYFRDTVPLVKRPLDRRVGERQGSMLFRFYVWKDMIEEWFWENTILGINFGKPQRSRSAEMLHQAIGEWSQDGWISPHNSYLHMIYRGGVVGISFVVGIFWTLVLLIREFASAKSATGLLLVSVLIYWFSMALTALIFELPYHAIPLWTVFGMTLAYGFQLKARGQGISQ